MAYFTDSDLEQCMIFRLHFTKGYLSSTRYNPAPLWVQTAVMQGHDLVQVCKVCVERHGWQ